MVGLYAGADLLSAGCGGGGAAGAGGGAAAMGGGAADGGAAGCGVGTGSGFAAGGAWAEFCSITGASLSVQRVSGFLSKQR